MSLLNNDKTSQTFPSLSAPKMYSETGFSLSDYTLKMFYAPELVIMWYFANTVSMIIFR